MPRTEHEARLVGLLQRLNGWRLWLLVSVAAVLAAETIVTLMSLALQGRVTADYLLTGLVAAGIVAPATLLLMSSLLKELASQQQQALSRSVESAETRLRVALDSSDEGVLMVATDGRVLSANKRFFELWRVPPALAAIGQDDLLLKHVLGQLTDPDGFLSAVKRLYGSDAQATDTLQFKDGRVFERYTRALALGAEQGRIWCFRDVSVQSQAHEALEDSRNLLKAIIDAAPMRVFWKDKNLRYLGCNPAFARDAGKTTPDELLGKDDFDMVWAAQAPAYRADDLAVMASGVGRLSFDEPQTTPDGQNIWLRTSKVPLRNHGGQVVGVLGVYEDITDRKLAEMALREREEIFSAIVNHSVEGILLVDAQTMEFTEFNDAACTGLGYTREEFSRLRLPDVQADLPASETLERCRAATQAPEGLRFESQHRCKDGSLRDRHVSNRPVEVRGRTYLAHVWHDVTESKRFDDVLRVREQYQRALLDNFPFAVWLKDEQSRFVAVNATFAKVFGWPSPDALVGKTDQDIAPADLAERYQADDRAVLQSGRSQQVEELIETEGRRTWFETYKSPVSIGGRVFGTVGFGRDITQRKEAEWNLKMASEVAQVVFWRFDLQTQALAFDRSDLSLLGLAPDESLNSMPSWLERMHPDDLGAFMARMQAALQPGAPVFDLEYRMRLADGQVVWVHSKGSVIHRGVDGQPQLAVGASMNITARKQIEQAARESEARSRNLATLLRLLADNVPDMIWAKDLNNRYLFANRAVCRQLLNAADTTEPVGKDDMYFALRERQRHAGNPNWHTFGELCQDTDTVTLQRGVSSVFEESGTLQGRQTYLDVHKAPFLNEQGQVIGTVGSARDITERKHTEAELERHRQHLEELVEQRTSQWLATEARASRILDSAADGLYGVDAHGRITFINHAACHMLGYTAEQVLGQSAHELFHHSRPDGRPYPASECAAGHAWHAGQEMRADDETYWHADGHAVPVALASHPLVERGQTVGAVISVVDVSAQRAAAVARESALVAAENLARARSEFLANMSHEIRTPMNGVLGFAQIGLRSHADPDKARNAFEKIIGSGQQLLGVVNEILDFSKIDAGELRIDATDMSVDEALQGALQLVADRARAKGLDLRLVKAPDLPAQCLCDPLRLGQVLLNLLTNAVKFTETGSITLQASRQADQLVFSVADTGIGMTAEQLGYVFNPFQQADGSTTRKFGGTGLGLAICKRLLELMQGDIQVQSTPGAGSVFVARLPYVPPSRPHHEPPAPPAELPDRPLAGLCILVAEDDEINQKVLELNLAESGAQLVLVGDGAAAVARVQADGPAAYDVVLMDIQMPVMDGLEATRRILAAAPGLPIIGQTAHAFNEDRDKCLAAGMAGFIAKPIDPQALTRLVLQVHQARRRVT